MLQIVVPEREYWNERTQQFVDTKEQTLCLEHSLVSISKWEAKYHKSFIKTFNKEPTDEEIRYYVKCMTLTQNVDPNVYLSLSVSNYQDVFAYINDTMSATYLNDRDTGTSRDVITSELIYYWMIQANIPFECQKWHLNRLLTLIRVCGIKNNQSNKKRSTAEIISDYKSENERRKKEWNTAG